MHLQSTTLAFGLVANAAVASSFECGTMGTSSVLDEILAKVAGRSIKEENVEIQTYVHVLATSEKKEDGYLTDETVQSQIDILNEIYNPLDFSFNLVETTRTVNRSWAFPIDSPGLSQKELELREAMRRGSYKDLNLYFIVDMPPGGKCNYPVANPTALNITADGCIMRPVDPSEQPPRFDLVTVHEVGHWLGLYHTFENGCEEPGDHVDDTPYEAYPVGSEDCPEPGRNTCPDKPGLDPVDNIMTYVGHECGPVRFTPGQAERMHKLWKELRE